MARAAFPRHFLLAREKPEKRGNLAILVVLTMGIAYVGHFLVFWKMPEFCLVFAIETKKAAKMKIFAKPEVLLRIAKKRSKTRYFLLEFCMIWALLIEMWADMLRFDEKSCHHMIAFEKLKIDENRWKSAKKRENAILAFLVIFV